MSLQWLAETRDLASFQDASTIAKSFSASDPLKRNALVTLNLRSLPPVCGIRLWGASTQSNDAPQLDRLATDYTEVIPPR